MIEAIVAAIVGSLLGVGGKYAYDNQKSNNAKIKSEKDIARAEQKASEIILKAKDDALETEKERRREWKKTEDRLADRETTLDRKLDELDTRAERLRKHEDEVEALKSEIREIRVLDSKRS